MKILEFNEFFPSGKNFTKYLRKLGHKVHFMKNRTKEKIPDRDYDIVHAHYAIQLSTLRLLSLERNVGKKIVLHLRGSDVRKLTFKYKPILWFEKLRSDLILYSTPDLAQHTNGIWIPNFADFDEFKPKGKPVYDDRIAVFVSSVSKPDWTKNMSLIHKLIKSMENEYKFDFIEGVSHKNIPKVIRKYPLVFGQLSGSYGNCEIEAMSCGIPTVFYVSPRILPMIGFENPSLENIELNKIIKFIRTHIGDTSFGKKQRKFIEKYHNPIKVTKNLIKIFEDLLAGNVPACDRQW